MKKKADFSYKLTVVYDEGYFTDPTMPLQQVLAFHSTSPRTKEYMQESYPHCTIQTIEPILK